MSLSKAKHPNNPKEKASESTQQTVEPTIRMNVNIPKAFYKQIKQHALDEDTTVTDTE